MLNEDIDKLMKLVRETRREFYNKYFGVSLIASLPSAKQIPISMEDFIFAPISFAADVGKIKRIGNFLVDSESAMKYIL